MSFVFLAEFGFWGRQTEDNMEDIDSESDSDGQSPIENKRKESLF